MRYLTVDVYNSGSDCTNGGVTSQQDTLLVVPCENGFHSASNVEEYGYTVLELQEPKVKNKGYPCTFRPAGETRWTMFGGNFVYSSDSRFGEKYGHSPVAVHDRIE